LSGAFEFAKNGCHSKGFTKTWGIALTVTAWIESTTTWVTSRKTAAGYRCEISQKTAGFAGNLTLHKMKTKYAKLVRKLKNQGADDPRALAAHIGRKKLGAEEFQRRAAAGRKAAR
jgi:hypothetical protein